MYTPFVGYQGDISRRGTLRRRACRMRERETVETWKTKRGAARRGRASGAATDVGLTVITPQCRDKVQIKNNGNATCYGYFQEITVMR